MKLSWDVASCQFPFLILSDIIVFITIGQFGCEYKGSLSRNHHLVYYKYIKETSVNLLKI